MVVEFDDLSELGLCIVQGAACPSWRIVICSAPPRTGRRRSPRRVWFRVTRRGPVNPSEVIPWLMAPNAFDSNGVFFQLVFSGERDVRQCRVVMVTSRSQGTVERFTKGLTSLTPSTTTINRGHRFGVAPNLMLVGYACRRAGRHIDVDVQFDCVTTSLRQFSIAFAYVSILCCPVQSMVMVVSSRPPSPYWEGHQRLCFRTAIGLVLCEFEGYANFILLFSLAIRNAVASAFTGICHFGRLRGFTRLGVTAQL